MKKKQSLTTFLKERGVTSMTPPHEIITLKKDYYKQYHKAYYHHRKRRIKRLNIRMEFSEYDRLKQYAKLHNASSMNVFLQQCAFAYLEKIYIPRDPKTLELLLKKVAAISNTISFDVQRLYRLGYSPTPNNSNALTTLGQRYELLVDQVEALKEAINTYMTTPPDDYSLEQAIQEHFSLSTQQIDHIFSLLKKTESEDDHQKYE